MDLGRPQVWVLQLAALGQAPGEEHQMDLPVAPQRAAKAGEQRPWSPCPTDHLLAAVVVVLVAVHRSLMVGERQKQVVLDPMVLRTCRLDTEK